MKNHQASRGEWTSPYRPLAKDAPDLPSRSQLEACIPRRCFERSYVRSTLYVLRDLILTALCVFIATKTLRTDFPSRDGDENYPVTATLWCFGWMTYAFVTGTVVTGIWVLAHECGHGALSPSTTLNDCMGFVMHHLLLVPYHPWKFSHAKHHRRTNHTTDGEAFLPNKIDGPCFSKAGFYDPLGDDAFAIVKIFVFHTIGWYMYLLGVESTGRLKWDGTPQCNSRLDHFRPNSGMFPPKMRTKVLVSTSTICLTLAALFYAKYRYGVLPVLLYYWAPYHVVNSWLVLYTWLHHTDASVPHYGEEEWTWVRGALSTIDRSYSVFDFFHHHIGSTHVLHHCFPEIPHYHAKEATAALRAFLEAKGLYNYDPTPIPVALWKIATTCHYVEGFNGVQYYKKYGDVDRNGKVD